MLLGTKIQKRSEKKYVFTFFHFEKMKRCALAYATTKNAPFLNP